MQALKLVDNNLAMVTVPKPVPQEGEALIRVIRAGICNTDLEILKGYLNFQGVIGHEFVGMVEEVSSSSSVVKTGDRVVGHINLICSHCPVCDAGGDGRRNHCPNRQTLGIVDKDGAHAQFMTLPVENLLVVPDNVSDVEATFAEPLAAACRIAEQGLVKPDQSVCVIGDGKLGMLITEVLALQQCRKLVLIGKHEEKLRLAPASVQTVVFTPETERQFLDSFDVTVEATGSPNAITSAVNVTRPLGTVVLKTTSATDQSFSMSTVVIKELKLIGSRCGPFDQALDLLSSRKVDVKKFLSKDFPFEKSVEAYEAAAQRGTLKVQLVM